MQHIFSAIFLGIATNLDNLMIGFGLGLEGKKLCWLSNLAIAASSALASFLSSALAALCAEIGPWMKYIGGGLLILLGLWPLIFGGEGAETEKKRKQAGSKVGLRETLMLSVVLAINCIPAAFGAGMAGAGAWQAAAAIGAGSFLAVGAGSWAGQRTGAHICGNKLEHAAALMMILLGILELFA